jgi:putative oxidoreductase
MQAALLRVGSGLIFFGFGLSKFTHHSKEARSFDRYSLPWPSLFAYAIGTLELSLGFLLVLGLATRLVAPALAGDMVGAIATAGRVEGGTINLGLAPALLVVMLVLAWSGAGRWAVDARLRRNLAGRSPAPF